MVPSTWRSTGPIKVAQPLKTGPIQLAGDTSTILGTSTMKEAVNRSLEMVVLAERRRRHADRLEQMRGLVLDPKVMSAAWR